MSKITKHLGLSAALLLALGAGAAPEATSRPGKWYGPDDVTAYMSVDWDGLAKSKTVSALMDDSAKQIGELKSQVREVIRAQLGTDIGDAWISSSRVLVFGNDEHRVAVVLRGTWNAAQANAIVKAMSDKAGLAPVAVSYHGHAVESFTINGSMAFTVDGGLKKATLRADGGDSKDEAFVSILDSGPVVVGASLASVTKVLDALDADPVSGDARLAPAMPEVPGTLGTVWVREIPGKEDRSDLPGPLQSLRSGYVVVGENAESAFVKATMTANTPEDAMRLNGMANGLLMLGRSATTEPAVQGLIGATKVTADGADIKLEWSWPLSRMDEIKALVGERHGKGAKLQVKIDDSDKDDSKPADGKPK